MLTKKLLVTCCQVQQLTDRVPQQSSIDNFLGDGQREFIDVHGEPLSGWDAESSSAA